MTITNPTIKELLKKYKEISLLNNISSTLNWDLNVNLPTNASAARSEQLAYLANAITEKWLTSDFRKLVEKAQNENGLNHFEKAIVRNITYATKFYYNVPKKTIVKKEEVTAAAFPVWKQAREENDFKKFLPYLTQIVEISQEIAHHLTYKTNPYDALLDQYEPELTAADCELMFNGLKKELVQLMKKVSSSETYTDKVGFVNSNLHYSIDDQKKILTYVTHKMGFDFASGRIDVSPHPFTTSLSHKDVRLTTNYNVRDFRDSYSSTVHEAGHGLYEQRIDPAYAQTPLEGGVSLGIHESLSRFWENMVGKNPHFLKSITPLFQTQYNEQIGTVNEHKIIRSFNIVKPSLVRIFADEVSYSLHIILRFEIENDLINGKLKPKDASDAWKAKSKELLGIAPETDKDGVLQDVHWTYGAIGYFPAYAMGNLYGAQFLHTMKKTIDVDTLLADGKLKPIKEWLDRHIHTHGSLYFPKELLHKATGEDLNYKYFLEYLNNKYSEIYDLK